MTVDIFQFWKEIGPHEKIHPQDRAVFDRVGHTGHGLNLKCLPACFAGCLKTAPVVFLFLSPGLNDGDLKDARTSKGRDKYEKRRTGEQPLSEEWTGYEWLKSRTQAFDVDLSKCCDKIAVLNIGAYHSLRFKDYPLLAALPSSRVSLDWAHKILFPKALAGGRVVVCLRAAHFWGLEPGKCHGRSLFAPHVTRGAHTRNKTKAEKEMRAKIAFAIKSAVNGTV
jgi:hypothetical protein